MKFKIINKYDIYNIILLYFESKVISCNKNREKLSG